MISFIVVCECTIGIKLALYYAQTFFNKRPMGTSISIKKLAGR